MKKIKFYYLVILGSLAISLTACNSEKMQITNEELISSCSLLSDEECIEKYQSIKNDPIKILDDQNIQISITIPCGIEFKTKSILEKDGRAIITLAEIGKNPADCGSELKIIKLKINKSIVSDELEVYRYIERSGQTEKIYPLK